MNFSRVQSYLQLLNDPDALAGRLGITAPSLRWSLRARSAMIRRGIQLRPEVLRYARLLLQRYKGDPTFEAELLDLAKTVREEGQLRREFVQFKAGIRAAMERVQALANVPQPPREKEMTTRRVTTLLRQAGKVLAPVLPTERQLARLHDRLRICPLCDKAYLKAPRKRAQRYCPQCRRRWSKQQLWYRTREKGGGRHGSATRTR